MKRKRLPRGSALAASTAMFAVYGCAQVIGITDVPAVEAGSANLPGPEVAPICDGACTDAGADANSDSVTALSAGNDHTCALLASGRVLCWGGNRYGQLGHDPQPGDCSTSPTSSCTAAPTIVTGADGKPLVRVRQIAAGNKFTCAVTDDRGVLCWGANNNHQLGRTEDGTNARKCSDVFCDPTPRPVPGLTHVTHLAAGAAWTETVCVVTDGQVQCWGANPYGILGQRGADGGALQRTPNGTAVRATVVLASPSPPVEVRVGTDYACALLQDRTPWCWGRDLSGVLHQGPVYSVDEACPPDGMPCNPTPQSTLGRPVNAMILGDGNACAVSTDAAPFCWGYSRCGEGVNGDLTRIPDAREIAGSLVHVCALTRASEVYCWGVDEFGACGQGLALPDAADHCVRKAARVDGLPGPVAHIAAGGNTTYATLADGTVWGWGDGTLGQLGAGIDGHPCGSNQQSACQTVPLRIEGLPRSSAP